MQNLQSTDVEEDPLAKLKGHKIVSCRICKGDHWTTKCPYKDTLAPAQENTDPDKEGEGGAPAAGGAPVRLGKYVPPNRRDGGNVRGETMMGARRGMCNLKKIKLNQFIAKYQVQYKDFVFVVA